jgi:hypothetical protein
MKIRTGIHDILIIRPLVGWSASGRQDDTAQ